MYIYGVGNLIKPPTIKVMTITEGLGLEDNCFEAMLKVARETYDEQETISDALLIMAFYTQREELNSSIKLSTYEKKLVLAGYLIGRLQSETNEKVKMAELVLGMLNKFSEEND